jgi:hypothetical protein
MADAAESCDSVMLDDMDGAPSAVWLGAVDAGNDVWDPLK